MSQFGSLEREQWHAISPRKRRPFMVDFWRHDLGYPSIDIGFDYHVEHVGHFKDHVIVDLPSWQAQQHSLRSQLAKDPWFLKRLLDNAQRHFDDILFPFFRSLPQRAPADPIQLAESLESHRQQMSRYCAYILLPLYVEDELTEQVRQGLAALDTPEEANERFVAATTMVEEGLLAQEQRRLLELAQLPEIALTDEVFAEVSERFSWMANQLYWMDFHSDDYYRGQIAQLRAQHPAEQLAAMDRALTDRRTAYQTLLNKIEDNQLRAAVETLQMAVWFRNFRGERLYQSSYYLWPTLRAAAQQLRLTEQELVWFTTPEIVEALRGSRPLDGATIAERRQGFALLTHINNDQVVSGQGLDELSAVMHLAQHQTGALAGQSAFPGNATGPAYVIHDLSDLANVPAGAVVVTHATTPAYVPVLNRVAAVITEEGGVLSHAAMIARELRVPTIIGVRGALAKIVPGAIVAVNATSGQIQLRKSDATI